MFSGDGYLDEARPIVDHRPIERGVEDVFVSYRSRPPRTRPVARAAQARERGAQRRPADPPLAPLAETMAPAGGRRVSWREDDVDEFDEIDDINDDGNERENLLRRKTRRGSGRPEPEVVGRMKRAAAFSTGAIVLGVLGLLVTAIPGTVLVGLKVSGRLACSWPQAFAPFFAGDALALVLELVALAGFLEHIRRSQMLWRRPSRRPEDDDALSRAPMIGKFLLRHACCEPLLEVAPPVTYLAFWAWFQGWLCLHLEGPLAFLSAVQLAAPLFALEAFVLLRLLFVHSAGVANGIFAVLSTLLAVLVAVKLDGRIPGASWWAVLAPLWAWYVVVAALFVRLFKRSDQLVLSTSQLCASFGYAGAAVVSLAASIQISLALNGPAQDAHFAAPRIAGLVVLTLVLLLFSVALIGTDYVRAMRRDGIKSLSIPAAGRTSRTSHQALEDWGT